MLEVVISLVALALLLAVAHPLLRAFGRNAEEMTVRGERVDYSLPDFKTPRNEHDLL